MGVNAVSTGNIVYLSSLDALYNRLYNLRNTHANSMHQINGSALSAAQSSSGLQAGVSLTKPDKLAILKQELQNLANSKWYTPNTENSITTMTDFGSSLSIPNVGDLLKVSDFNLIESAITTAESIIPNYSSKYNSCYGSQYGTRYGSQYGTQYGSQYGTRYSSDYGTRYSAQYGTQYGSQYGARYSAQYSTRYGNAYSSRYSGRYGTRYLTRAVQVRC